jgi:hypothetical protein
MGSQFLVGDPFNDSAVHLGNRRDPRNLRSNFRPMPETGAVTLRPAACRKALRSVVSAALILVDQSARI